MQHLSQQELVLSCQVKRAGFDVQQSMHLRFQAPFKLEWSFKAKDKLLQLKAKLPDLWNEVQDCIKNQED
jgi:hypothetical protein